MINSCLWSLVEALAFVFVVALVIRAFSLVRARRFRVRWYKDWQLKLWTEPPSVMPRHRNLSLGFVTISWRVPQYG